MKKMKKGSPNANPVNPNVNTQPNYTVEAEEKSILFKDEIEELFSLCMQAMQTTAYVSFYISNYSGLATVVINDFGFDGVEKRFYDIHISNGEMFDPDSRRAYENAKKRLLRILEVAK